MKNVYIIFLLFLLQIINLTSKIQAQNPSLVKDINNTNKPPFGYYNYIQNDGLLYFNATDNAGLGLWRSDGTGVGTYRISNVYTYDPAALNDIVLFGAGYVNGGEL